MLAALTLLLMAAAGLAQAGPTSVAGCTPNAATSFGVDLFKFGAAMYKLTARRYGMHFASSPYATWFSLAALAEGSVGSARQELFDVLHLPQEECIRRKYYEVALALEQPGPDMTLARKRYLVLDTSPIANETFAVEYMTYFGLNMISASLRSNPESALRSLRELISARLLSLDFSGNSVMLDSLDYKGPCTIAFSGAKIQRNAPFYDDGGKQIGTVDLMRMRKFVKMVHIPLLNVKVIQLPIGKNERFSIFLLMGMDKTPLSSTIELINNAVVSDIFTNIHVSKIPLEIAIPRFNLTTELPDLRDILEKMGARSVWGNAEATPLISTPGAAPSAFVQRVRVAIDADGDEPYEVDQNTSQLTSQPAQGTTTDKREETVETSTGLAAALGREFIANRPFVWAIVEDSSRITLFSGAFSTPDVTLSQ